MRAAAAGKHIFMEKPLAFYPEDIREMDAAREKAGIQVQVGLVLRYEPVFWFLQELMQKEKERLGSLLSFIFRTDQEWPITGSAHDSAWRSDRSLAYRGCLFEHSIHDLDLLLSFFGDYKGVAARIGYRSRLARESGIEDLATVLLSFENGVSGNLTSIFHRIKGRDVRRLELIFEGSRGFGWIRPGFARAVPFLYRGILRGGEDGILLGRDRGAIPVAPPPASRKHLAVSLPSAIPGFFPEPAGGPGSPPRPGRRPESSRSS